MSEKCLPAQPVDATQALISLLGFQIARSHVVVRLADEPLCSDGLANAPTSRCPLESTVSAGHWHSRSTRAATGFAGRKNRHRCWSPSKSADDPSVPCPGPRSGTYTALLVASS